MSYLDMKLGNKKFKKFNYIYVYCGIKEVIFNWNNFYLRFYGDIDRVYNWVLICVECN